MAKKKVLTYLHFRVLEWPLILFLYPKSQIPRATMNFHRPVMSSLRWRRGASRQFVFMSESDVQDVDVVVFVFQQESRPICEAFCGWPHLQMFIIYDELWGCYHPDMMIWSCLLKWGVPQAIIHFDGIFHCKPSSYWCTPIVGMWSCFRPAASHVTNASPITEVNVAQIQTSNGQVGMLNITHFWLKIGLSWWFVDLLTSFSFQWGKSQWSAQKNSTSTCDGFNMFQSMKLCVASGFSTFHAGKVGMWKSSSQIQWPF